MTQIIASYYALIFKITKSSQLAYYTSLVIVTILCIITLSGLSRLLQDAFPTGALLKAFAFPYCIGTGAVIFILLLLTSPPMKFTGKEVRKKPDYTMIFLSILISLLMFAYNYIAPMI